MKRQHRHIYYYVNFCVFFAVLTIMGIWFLLQKQETKSIVEKRLLKDFPEFNYDSIYHGKYTRAIDDYVADHFPYRDKLVSFALRLKELKGYHSNELIIISKPKKPKRILGKDSANVDLDTAMLDGEVIEDNRGLVISNGRAMQLFGGNNSRAKTYGNMVNAFYNELKAEGINVFNVVVPSAAEFYLPAKFRHLREQEKRNINLIYETELEGIKKVDAYSKIAAHKDEYVYFRTDHHWTGLGAYYAYSAFCESAGFEAMPLDEMTKKSKNKFNKHIIN